MLGYCRFFIIDDFFDFPTHDIISLFMSLIIMSEFHWQVLANCVIRKRYISRRCQIKIKIEYKENMSQ